MSVDTSVNSSRFSSDVYASRLARAARLTSDAGLDALLITPGPDLQYLLGSKASSFERLIALVVPADGSIPSVIVPRLELAALGDSAAEDLSLTLVDWVDGVDPYALVAAAVPAGSKTAVADAMPALHFVPLADVFGLSLIHI